MKQIVKVKEAYFTRPGTAFRYAFNSCNGRLYYTMYIWYCAEGRTRTKNKVFFYLTPKTVKNYTHFYMLLFCNTYIYRTICTYWRGQK